MHAILAWILSFMVVVAPPGRKTYYPEAQETKAATEARYQSIATDIVDVVYDPATKPLFKGPTGRARTVAVILSVMDHESSFARNVDYGLGKYARGDHGESWCMMQLRIGSGRTMKWNTVKDRPARPGDPPEDVFEGYTGEELVKDRKKCIQEGLKVLRVSFGACSRLPLLQRLRSYASGSCQKGAHASEARMGMAIRWFARSKKLRTFKDADIVSLVEAQHQALPPPTAPPAQPDAPVAVMP